jgi:hypothetical protein
MNLLALKNKVIERLRERSTPRHWTASEIVDAINRSCRKFARDTKPYEQILPLTVVDITEGAFAFPARLMKQSGVYWNGIKLFHVDSSYLDNYYRGEVADSSIGDAESSSMAWRDYTADIPTHWLIDDGKVRLFPIPLTMNQAGSLRDVQTDTLAAGTTTITIAGPLPPDQDLIDVYLNGVYQNKDQWSITNETTITMVGSTPVDCDVEVVFFVGVTATNTNTIKYVLSLPAGASVLNIPRPYVVGDSAISIKINGVSQAPSAFTESTSTTVTLATALVVASEIEVTIYERAGAWPCTMKCVRMPTEMVNDTDEPDLPTHLEDYHDALWMWAMVECFSREGQEKDMGMASFYGNLYSGRIADYKEAFGTPILTSPRDAWRA